MGNSKSKKVIQKIVLAAAITNGKNEILILQRNSDEKVFPNMWELPSGKREEFEDTLKSLIREVKEETGLDAEILYPISTFDYKIEKPDEIRDTVQINFLVKVVGGKVKISSEHQNYEWINRQQLDNFGISKETKKVISITFNILKPQ